MSPSVMQDNT